MRINWEEAEMKEGDVLPNWRQTIKVQFQKKFDTDPNL